MRCISYTVDLGIEIAAKLFFGVLGGRDTLSFHKGSVLSQL